jgi:hypothetical protein
MQEIIQLIADKAGITTDQATTALQTMQEYFAKNQVNTTQDNTTAKPEQQSGGGIFEEIKEKAEGLLGGAGGGSLIEKAEEVFNEIKGKL